VPSRRYSPVSVSRSSWTVRKISTQSWVLEGERRIASDMGPLITLEKLSNGYRFIRLFYDKILIPRIVLEELALGQFLNSGAYLLKATSEENVLAHPMRASGAKSRSLRTS
jgi:hypothetical protein